MLAQELNSTEFSGMPESAIRTGIVDQVLVPEAMPELLARFASHDYICSGEPTQRADAEAADAEDLRRDSPDLAPRDATAERLPAAPDATEADLGEIIKLLAKQAKRDFHNYKLATLSRRTRRRMCLHQINRYEDYLEFLRENPGEVPALAKDLLISVTDFFRDSHVWDVLAAQAIPQIIASKSHDDVVRVWSAGCATGRKPIPWRSCAWRKSASSGRLASCRFSRRTSTSMPSTRLALGAIPRALRRMCRPNV